jgi:hypothetical protein
VKTLGICTLSALLSIVAYAEISDALSGPEQPPAEAPATRWVPPPVAESADNDRNVVAHAEYLHLHATRGEGSVLHGAAGTRACTK